MVNDVLCTIFLMNREHLTELGIPVMWVKLTVKPYPPEDRLMIEKILL